MPNSSWEALRQEELQKKFLASVEKVHDICLPEELVVWGRRISVIYSHGGLCPALKGRKAFYDVEQGHIVVCISEWCSFHEYHGIGSYLYWALMDIKAYIRQGYIRAYVDISIMMPEAGMSCSPCGEEFADWFALYLPSIMKELPEVVVNGAG